jgi:hypothetical protein
MRGDPNRAHLEKQSGVHNPPAERSAFGPVAERTVMGERTVHDPNCVPGVEMGPGILGKPINSDPHAHQRRSDNLSKAPFERPGSHYAEENRRRIHGRGVDYK